MEKKGTTILARHILLVPAALCLFAALGCITASHVQIQMPPQRAMEIEFEVMQELEKFKGKIRKDIKVCVGSFLDKTGQHKDTERTRYSRAVTQGGDNLLYHMLYKALGPKVVVERETGNWNRLYNEYAQSWANVGGKPQRGLIRHGGPTGGLAGCSYLVSGAVVYYHADRYSGGGGVNIEGIGGNFETYLSRVGMELRLVDMSTSEIHWSTMVESWVSGRKIGVDVFRFMSALGDEFLVQAEAGLAQYLPADYAFETCMATAVVDMIEENQDIFVVRTAAKKTSKRAKEAKQPSAQNKQRKQRKQQVGTNERKESKQPVPFWQQPAYRSPSPGHGE